MEIFNVFSIADFLAYLFPGVLSLSGIYAILLITPLKNFLPSPGVIGLGGWAAFLFLSYITGVLIATVTDTFFRERPKSLRRKQNKGSIQIHDEKLKAEVLEAFNETILSPKGGANKKTDRSSAPSEWNEYCYYVCRSLVTEAMPRAAANGLREGAYRQLRMNLIGSILIWGVAGVLWGLFLLIQPGSIYIINGNNVIIAKGWSGSLVALSISLPIYLVAKLVTMMDKHERREVREILTSFLAGYKTGIFDKRAK
ncbi:MAG: hypothetical protein H6636_03145 [Anaerolineales bacterium]|nr:hypothetical protein [Anaerolineales bacterium]